MLSRLTSSIKRLAPCFYTRKLGVGITHGGCEAAVHSAHRYIEALTQDHVLAKLDFTVAFIRIHRNEMPRYAHAQHNPGDSSYRIDQLTANRPFCFFSVVTVSSQKGAWQDALAPAILQYCTPDAVIFASPAKSRLHR